MRNDSGCKLNDMKNLGGGGGGGSLIDCTFEY